MYRHSLASLNVSCLHVPKLRLAQESMQLDSTLKLSMQSFLEFQLSRHSRLA